VKKKADNQYILELIISDLTGIISEAEKQQLESLMHSDPRVNQKWHELRRQYSAAQIQDAFNRYDSEWSDTAAITGARLQARRRRLIILTKYAAVALVIMLAAASVLYFRHTNNHGPANAIAANDGKGAGPKEIKLQLATGKTISLSSLTADSTSVSGITLSRTGKSLSYDGNTSGMAGAGINTLTVPVGKDFHLTLSDGSEIWLNAATVLSFPFNFTGSAREITVTGEAYLKVAPDASRPFRVHTSRGVVDVLGTEFNINAYDSTQLKVALVKGAVRLEAGGSYALLQPGKEAVYAGTSGIKIRDFEEDMVVSWRKGLFNFREATLQEITSVLPRWYGVQVIMDRPALTHAHFTGIMNRNAPITDFLENVKFAMGISYYFDEKGVLHFK
jgi:ferric-dicitrate binding protein FerR (iron transport regulator)